MMACRWFTLVLLALASFSVWGCSDDDNDFLVSRGSGTTLAAATGTGNLLFSFALAQSAVVPTQSNQLLFEFFELSPNREPEGEHEPLLVRELPFAPAVTVLGVPVTARFVRITVYDESGRPLLTLTDEVSVRPDQVTPVDLGDAEATEVEAQALELFPDRARLEIKQTLQLEVLVAYSNADVVPLSSDQVSRLVHFQAEPSELAEVDSRGLVTPVASGQVRVTATHRSLGTASADFVITSSD